jgi:hypothetical protein
VTDAAVGGDEQFGRRRRPRELADVALLRCESPRRFGVGSCVRVGIGHVEVGVKSEDE